jgi:hypothetical protein
VRAHLALPRRAPSCSAPLGFRAFT